METDALAMRDWLCGLLDWQEINAVLDVGCGAGGDLRRIAAFASPALRLVGVDSSAKAIEAARAATLADTRFAWHRADVSQGLPFADGEFDALLSLNLLECVPDKAASDGWMGRRLWPTFQQAGPFTGRIETYTLTDTVYAPGRYGYEQVQAFGALARRGLISADDYSRFADDMAAQAARGGYFYSITLYAYVGQK